MVRWRDESASRCPGGAADSSFAPGTSSRFLKSWRRGVAIQGHSFVGQLMDTESFDDAFEGLYKQATALGYRILGDHEAAEDVASEAMIRTFVRWERVRALPYRDGWVMRVTTNLAIDRARRRSRHNQLAIDRHPDRTDDGTELAVLRSALVEALLRLPKRQREAIVLVHLLGYTATDAAKAMHVSPSSVGQHLRRGLGHIRSNMPASEHNIDFPPDEVPNNAVH